MLINLLGLKGLRCMAHICFLLFLPILSECLKNVNLLVAFSTTPRLQEIFS